MPKEYKEALENHAFNNFSSLKDKLALLNDAGECATKKGVSVENPIKFVGTASYKDITYLTADGPIAQIVLIVYNNPIVVLFDAGDKYEVLAE